MTSFPSTPTSPHPTGAGTRPKRHFGSYLDPQNKTPLCGFTRHNFFEFFALGFYWLAWVGMLAGAALLLWSHVVLAGLMLRVPFDTCLFCGNAAGVIFVVTLVAYVARATRGS